LRCTEWVSGSASGTGALTGHEFSPNLIVDTGEHLHDECDHDNEPAKGKRELDRRLPGVTFVR
jgi:hypothetical protein